MDVLKPFIYILIMFAFSYYSHADISSVDFETVDLTSSTKTRFKTITLKNQGTQKAMAIQITANSVFSKVSDTCTAGVEKGTACTAIIKYEPTKVETSNGILTIIYGDNSNPSINSPKAITLTGNSTCTGAGFYKPSDNTCKAITCIKGTPNTMDGTCTKPCSSGFVGANCDVVATLDQNLSIFNASPKNIDDSGVNNKSIITVMAKNSEGYGLKNQKIVVNASLPTGVVKIGEIQTTPENGEFKVDYLSTIAGSIWVYADFINSSGQIVFTKGEWIEVKDITPPTVPVIQSPTSSTPATKSKSIEVRGTCETLATILVNGDIEASPVQVSCNNSSFSSNVNLTSSVDTTSKIGLKAIRVTQKDQASPPNISPESSVSVTYTTYVAPPTVDGFNYSPFVGANTTNRNWFELKGGCESGGGTIIVNGDLTSTSEKEIPCNYDGVSSYRFSGTITVTSGDGVKNFSLKLKDFFGNESTGVGKNVTLDSTSPGVSGATTPANNATGVAISGNLVVKFNEKVKQGPSGSIYIRLDGTTTNAATIARTSASISTDETTVTIPYSGLSNSTIYTVHFDSGAIQDLAGNNYELPYTNKTAWKFTTVAPPITAPTIAGITINESHTNNAVNLSWSSTAQSITNYKVYRGVGTIPIYNGTGTTYSDTGRSANTSYTYKIIVSNVSGQAEKTIAVTTYADELTFTSSSMKACSGTSITLFWAFFTPASWSQNIQLINNLNCYLWETSFGGGYIGLRSWSPTFTGFSTNQHVLTMPNPFNTHIKCVSHVSCVNMGCSFTPIYITISPCP